MSARLEILRYGRFVLAPFVGLLGAIGFPLGWFIGLIQPRWGHAIWGGLNALVERVVL